MNTLSSGDKSVEDLMFVHTDSHKEFMDLLLEKRKQLESLVSSKQRERNAQEEVAKEERNAKEEVAKEEEKTLETDGMFEGCLIRINKFLSVEQCLLHKLLL